MEGILSQDLKQKTIAVVYFVTGVASLSKLCNVVAAHRRGQLLDKSVARTEE